MNKYNKNLVKGCENMAKVDISASGVVALIGALILIAESVLYIQSLRLFGVIFGIIGIVAAIIIILTIQIVEIENFPIPFEWWSLLLVGGLILILFLVAGNFMTTAVTGAILILIAGIIEFLAENKDYLASQIVIFIGSILTIFGSILLFASMNALNIFLGILGLIAGIILLLAMLENVDIKVPYDWWIILIIGFFIFTWVYSLAGTIILVGFVLFLMDY